MNTPLELILNDLGNSLGVPLHPDQHEACFLTINDNIQIQLELDVPRENLLLVAFLGEVNPGKFREEVLKECLKANLTTLSLGMQKAILGYSTHHNQLTCHTILNVRNLNNAEVVSAMASLSSYAFLWKESIGIGQPSPAFLKLGIHGSPFGLRP